MEDKMKVSYRKLPSGNWQIYFTWEKKRIFLNKRIDGEPIKTDFDLNLAVAYLRGSGYDEAEWNKDKQFNLGKAIDNWIKFSNCGEDHKAERRRLKKMYVKAFGENTDIRLINSTDITKFHQSLSALKPKSQKNYENELKTLLRFFNIPLPRFPKITIQEQPIIWLTVEEQNRIFQFIAEQHRPIFDFMRIVPVRMNEACGLQKSDIFKDEFFIQHAMGKNGKLHESTKTKKLRPLPLTPEIEEIIKRSKSPNEFVFSRNGKAYSTKYLEFIWDEANRKATEEFGTKRCNLYNAHKHSFGFQKLEEGHSLDKIGAAMGHRDNRSTQKYARHQSKNLVDLFTPNAQPQKAVTTKNPSEKLVSRTGIEPVTY